MVKEWLHEQCAKKSEQVTPICVYKYPGRLVREGLASWFKMWGFKNGVEIGTREGKFAEVLLNTIPDLQLTCVDPWSTHDYRSRLIGQEQQDIYYQTCVKNLSKFGERVKIMKTFSMNAVQEFKDNSLDFVYIDGSHEFDDVMRDIIEWAKKVRPDGIVSGHDYYRFKRAGVVQAVDLYTHMHKIDEWYITDEREPTWFWAK
mgnify:CR=1 FL=1